MTNEIDASTRTQGSLPVSSDQLLQTLNDWEIAFSYFEHAPLKTVEDAKQLQSSVFPDTPVGGYTKNLYLRDKRKQNLLLVAEQDRAIDLKKISKRLGTASLSFGSADRLMQNLGVRPGAVSPLAMINGVRNGVRLFVDSDLRNCACLYVHPLVNDRTLGLSVPSLLKFLGRIKADVVWVNLSKQ